MPPDAVAQWKNDVEMVAPVCRRCNRTVPEAGVAVKSTAVTSEPLMTGLRSTV